MFTTAFSTVDTNTMLHWSNCLSSALWLGITAPPVLEICAAVRV